ncbi:trypsin-like serine peptidase [Azospirillum sp. ST 5-10]|uniref:trypsin-like serine peptidase n=1 Tax=unclassified Azospirillum TaxID=2630922 RepID=UPI003F49C610
MTTCSPWRSAGAALALLAGLAAAPAGAATADPLLPGVAADDHRVPVDVGAPPWSAVARVQTNLGGRCSGALVAPDRVLTAAHCLFNPRTRRLFEASSLHVLFGYDRGAYRVHRTVERYDVGPAYDGSQPMATLAADWAVLTLAPGPPTGATPLPVADEPPAAGTALALAGFSQDRAHRLMADRRCRALPSPDVLLRHDCSASRGASGGPLLRADGTGWAVVGVSVAVSTAADRPNLAVPASAFRPALPR